MKKVGIDTNVLISARLERPEQLSKIRKLFSDCLEGKVKIVVPETVILEIEWVLRSYYQQSKDQVVDFLDELIGMDNLELGGSKNIGEALSLYKTSSGISFTDAVILTEIRNSSVDEFFTLDDKLSTFYQKIVN